MPTLTRPDAAPAADLNVTRRGALGLFTAGYALALSAEAQAADPVTTPEDGLSISEITFEGADGYALPAYVARPADVEPGTALPAIVVVNEIFGVHAYIKDVCRRLAQAGYVASAPDYFDRAGDPSQTEDWDAIRAIVAATPHDQVMDDTLGAVDWLKADAGVDGERLGVTGFCWGGAVTWMACAGADTPFRAGVAWYGRLTRPESGGFMPDEDRPWPVDVAADLGAPVLGLYADTDRGIPLTDVAAMEGALAEAGNPTGSLIIVYPEAEHGFHADYRRQYKESAATDGWAKLTAWFAKAGV